MNETKILLDSQKKSQQQLLVCPKCKYVMQFTLCAIMFSRRCNVESIGCDMFSFRCNVKLMHICFYMFASVELPFMLGRSSGSENRVSVQNVILSNMASFLS